jgi:phage shock protein A
METRNDDLFGMTTAEAKEYILQHLATLRLTEKRRGELDGEVEKWTARLALAQGKGLEDLAAGAQGELERSRAERDRIALEAEDLRGQIERMIRQLPALGARERSVDPDLLEQELLMATGALPGDEDRVKLERDLRALEKTQGVQSDLAALKAKIADEKGTDKP